MATFQNGWNLRLRKALTGYDFKTLEKLCWIGFQNFGKIEYVLMFNFFAPPFNAEIIAFSSEGSHKSHYTMSATTKCL